jgi:hypothetical protein
MERVALGLLPVVVLAAAGCGSGKSSSGSSNGCDGGCWQPTPADQAFVAAFCGLSEACCVQNGRRTAPDVAGCMSRFATVGVSGDATLQQACLTELQSLAASTACLPELWQVSDACVRVFNEPSGPQHPGQPCVTSGDCAGTPGKLTYCSPDPSQASPTGRLCLQVAPGQPGDHTCLGNMNADGVIISAAFYRANTGVPPIATGFVCQARDGFYCAATDDPTTTACAAFGAAGASCNFATTCASGACSGSENDAGTCLAPVGVGAACGGSVVCDATSYCRNDGTTPTPVCTTKAGPGADCHYEDDAVCTTGNCDINTYICSGLTHAESISQLAFCTGIP